MTGTIAQQLALISYGNDFLKSGVMPEIFYPANSTFRFCKSVIFTSVRKSLFGLMKEEVILANDPNEWLSLLKSEGCERLELYYEHSKDQSFAKDHMLAGFVGGGGIWALQATYRDHKIFWLNNWMVTDANDVNQNIWTVKYGRASRSVNVALPGLDLNVIKNDLNSILISIRDFAVNQKLYYWTDVFNQSLTVLDSTVPAPEYYKDMLYSPSHSLIALQILYSASVAFVFGGMGSWNDLGFEENTINKEYESLSETLYQTIINAIIAAINHR